MAPAGTAASITRTLARSVRLSLNLRTSRNASRDARIAESQGKFDQNGHVKAMMNVGDQDVSQHRAREDEGKELPHFHQQQHREPVVRAPQRDAERFELIPRGDGVQRQIGRKKRNPGQPEPGSARVRRALRPARTPALPLGGSMSILLARSEAHLEGLIPSVSGLDLPDRGRRRGIIAYSDESFPARAPRRPVSFKCGLRRRNSRRLQGPMQPRRRPASDFPCPAGSLFPVRLHARKRSRSMPAAAKTWSRLAFSSARASEYRSRRSRRAIS